MAVLLALPSAALPASKSKSKGKPLASGEVYRCRDERGQYQYGQDQCLNGRQYLTGDKDAIAIPAVDNDA